MRYIIKKRKTIDIILICIIVFASVFPMILYRKNIGITVYSIISIGMLLIHLLLGLLAYVFRHNGNYIGRRRFLKHPSVLIFSSDKSYAFTEEYKKHFNRMLAEHFVVVPLYIPCIFLAFRFEVALTSVAVYTLPLVVYLIREFHDVAKIIKEEKLKKEQELRELEEQKRREEMGYWK